VNTITGIESATPIGTAITWQRTGQTITWSVPVGMLPADVSISVTVASGLAPDTTFDNTAYVGSQATNTTSHKLKAGWTVTERYLLQGADTQLDDDLTADVEAGAAWQVQGSTTLLAGYAYLGYQRLGLDSTMQAGPPPAPAYDATTHSSDFTTTNREAIILYYGKAGATVTIHFVDESGAEIASPVIAGANRNQDYYLLNSYFNDLTVAEDTYTYYNYAANNDGSVKDQGTPAPPLALGAGASPVHPDGSAPTFTAAQMTSSKDVTLYFTAQKAVTIHYVERGNASHILRPPATFFVPATFDADSTVADTLADSATSTTYYYKGWSSEGGAAPVPGKPGVVTAPATVLLQYASYRVEVRYHLLRAYGEVIAVDTVNGDWKPGDVVDPSALLNAHKPDSGFYDGVAVGENWVVSENDITTFDVYYPTMNPPITGISNVADVAAAVALAALIVIGAIVLSRLYLRRHQRNTAGD